MSDLASTLSVSIVAVAAALADVAAADPEAASLTGRLTALATLGDGAPAAALTRAIARAEARLRDERPVTAGPLVALLCNPHPAAARFRAAAVEELLLAGEPDLARLVELYRREVRAALAAAGAETPPWRLIGPPLIRLLGELLPAAFAGQARLRRCLPTEAERALFDRLRAARIAAFAPEPFGQSIVATSGASIAQVRQTIVHGDLYALPASPPPDLPLLYARYRAFVAETFGALDFRGIMQGHTATRIPLERIYVPLMGRARHDERGPDAPPASLHEFVRAQPLLVVLGDPGSGKSTLVRYLLLSLTRGDARRDLGLDPLWLPIFFPVAAFATARSQPGAGDLSPLEYLSVYYGGLSQPDYSPLFLRALTMGRALVLFDGLDEVRDDRQGIVRALEAFAREWDAPGNRFVATARIVGYEEAPLDPDLFAVVIIQPLSDELIGAFIERWSRAYAAIGAPPAASDGDLLSDLMREAASAEVERRVAAHVAALSAAVFSTPQVTDLARNPLLLTILALIHYQGARLPDRRADLYRLCVEALAETWNRTRSLSGRPIAVQLGDEQIDERFVVNVLGPVALWLHGERAGGLIEHDELERHIAATLAQSDGLPRQRARRLAREFIELMRRDTGLLIERGYRRFAFLHLTFEEYLAARGLLESVAVERPDALIQRYALDPRWHEVLRLAIASASQREAQRLLLSLLASPAGDEQRGLPAVLAGECLLDAGRNAAGGRAWEAGLAALLAVVADPAAPLNIRVAAGGVLGRLGDPRLLDLATGRAAGAGEAVVPDYWCDVPAGTFWHGDERQRRGRRAALKPVELPYAFRIARYPVTNAEFARFIAAGGYGDPRWWSVTGRAFLQPDGQRAPPEERGTPITQPGLWRVASYNGPTQPVVGVSWYEAAAFCAWLTAEGRAAGWLYPGEMLRLPTALEWERAARHLDQRLYPWGDEPPDTGRANFADCALHAPSPIGCFPAGAAVCGALDLAGNVWEWTCSLADAPEERAPRADVAPGETPVIKGGAFNWQAEGLRCGAYHRFPPIQRYNVLGFRLVWVVAEERL
ncbi:MAG: SUMF1/EgtB/PvdO family nonheme iron enzyme [Oscillochloridaceae bacterium]|nr:SUMF1/EgtB/PvdO family nonheme iron enzyme [Chloroflexaceae bacterium]MDW8392090.1 SUMF1/EgtB/PvdO family nonheme iron enzyme [Oscillochloridaceae bacterium]